MAGRAHRHAAAASGRAEAAALLTGRAALAERLAREREILATLSHPNIARLYDAGVAADGQPYLALEYVEGERIDAWCTRKALDITARLHLFLQVARAVAHAHANLVVHRDLKPANVLVTDAGEVRLLDFGIAKLLDDGRAQETALTQLAGRALTPDYAAPEQILGQPIGTAADVYALGVVLFELLTGRRPYKLKRDSRAALEEAIMQAEVQRPSETATDAKRKRRLRGDLDTIVLKALKKAPAERYGTVQALAEDIERHLDQRPVKAQPESRIYRLNRFVARNRLAVGAAAGVLIAVFAGTGVAVWQAQIAVAEHKRADEVKTFIAELLRDANPALQGGRKISVDELLVGSRTRIDEKFAGRPQIRAELLTIVATSLSSIGEYQAAGSMFEAAAQASAQALGAEHPQTLHSRAMLVGSRRLTNLGPEVVAEADDVLDAMRRTRGVDPAYFANLLVTRSHMAMDVGRHDQSIAFGEEALRVATERIGETKEQTLNTAVALALAYQRAGDWRNALDAARRVHRLAFDVLKLSDTHPNAIDARLMLGIALADAGEPNEGVAQLEAGVRYALASSPPTHSRIASYRTHLARAQLRAGRINDAIGHLEAALEVQRNALGVKSRRFASTAVDLGGAYLAARRPERALAPLREAQAFFAGTEDSLAPIVAARLAAALASTGAGGEGEILLAPIASRDGEVLWRRSQIARMAGRHADALALQQQALEAVPDVPAQQALRADVMVEQGLVSLDAAPADALAVFEQAAATLRKAQSVPTPALAEAQMGSGRALLLLGRTAESITRLDQAAALWQQIDPTLPASVEAARWRADALRESGLTNRAM